MNSVTTTNHSPRRQADTRHIVLEESLPLTLILKVMNLVAFMSLLQGRRVTVKAVGLFYRLAHFSRPARPAK